MPMAHEVADRHYKKPCLGCGKPVGREEEHSITFYRGEFRVFHDDCWPLSLQRTDQSA